MANKVDFCEEKVLFSKLTKDKAAGKTLSLVNLTKPILRQLWADEFVKDRDIAVLFSTSATEVRKLRHKYEFSHATCMASNLDRALKVLGVTGASIMML